MLRSGRGGVRDFSLPTAPPSRTARIPPLLFFFGALPSPFLPFDSFILHSSFLASGWRAPHLARSRSRSPTCTGCGHATGHQLHDLRFADLPRPECTDTPIQDDACIRARYGRRDAQGAPASHSCSRVWLAMSARVRTRVTHEGRFY